MKLPRGQFIRLGYPCDPRHTRQDLKYFLTNGMAVPYCTYDSLLNPLNNMRSKVLAFDYSKYVFNLFLAGSRMHDN